MTRLEPLKASGMPRSNEEVRLSDLYATYTPKQLHENRAQITCIGGRD